MAASWLRAHRVRPGGGAPVKTGRVQGPKWMLEVAGHYARPDVFELVVRTETRPMLVVRKRVPAALGREAEGSDREASRSYRRLSRGAAWPAARGDTASWTRTRRKSSRAATSREPCGWAGSTGASAAR